MKSSLSISFSVHIQFSSVAQSCPTLCDRMDCSTPDFPVCPSPTPEACSVSCPSSRWCHPTSHPLLSPSPPSFNHSQHLGLFQWVSSSHQVAKVLEFQLQNQSFQCSGLISFRVDQLDLLAVQGALKNPLKHHSSKASILQCSAFFIDQLSHPYMTTGKTIALTRWTFVGKATSLLFNAI